MGNEINPCCGIIAERKIIENFLKFPVGYHGVFIFAHPNSRVLASFVSFYGLFYFWVILSTEFQAFSAFDPVLLEDPQNQATYEPQLRGKIGNLLVQWRHIAHPYISDPNKTAFLTLKYAHERFQQTSNEFYDSKKLRQVLTSAN
jgi:hypothetical protein